MRREFEHFKMEIKHSKARQALIEAAAEDEREGAESPSLKAINQIYEGTWQPQQSPGSRGVCHLHWHHLLELYCLTHSTPICKKCFTEEHSSRKCSVGSVGSAREQE